MSKYKNKKEWLAKSMDFQREIFIALDQSVYKKRGLQIRKNDLFVQAFNSAKNSEWKKLEEVTVTFELQGTQSLYSQYFKQVSPSSRRTMSRTKNFQIYFKRINGRWFWNPFGW